MYSFRTHPFYYKYITKQKHPDSLQWKTTSQPTVSKWRTIKNAFFLSAQKVFAKMRFHLFW